MVNFLNLPLELRDKIYDFFFEGRALYFTDIPPASNVRYYYDYETANSHIVPEYDSPRPSGAYSWPEEGVATTSDSDEIDEYSQESDIGSQANNDDADAVFATPLENSVAPSVNSKYVEPVTSETSVDGSSDITSMIEELDAMDISDHCTILENESQPTSEQEHISMADQDEADLIDEIPDTKSVSVEDRTGSLGPNCFLSPGMSAIEPNEAEDGSDDASVRSAGSSVRDGSVASSEHDDSKYHPSSCTHIKDLL